MIIAIVLKVITDKVIRLMELTLDQLHLGHFALTLGGRLLALRNVIADIAVPDRTHFVNVGIAIWSKIVAIFRSGSAPSSPDCYEYISATNLNALQGDPNVQAVGMGKLGIALSLLQKGQVENMWVIGPPADAHVTHGALRGRANRAGADDRPIFIVRSAAEAIILMRDGAFSSGQAVVIHGDDGWHTLSGGASSRQIGAAPGRTGMVTTTHVSLGMLLAQATDVTGLQEQFAAGVLL